MDGEIVMVAYDGDCLMCSRSIRFLAEHDPQRRFRFLTLQSNLGREMARRAGEEELRTVLVETGGRILTRSRAVLACMAAMSGLWKPLAWLGVLVPGRDLLYDWIARHRHEWFPGGATCELPSPALRERLISGEEV